jgi:hypothetical protein
MKWRPVLIATALFCGTINAQDESEKKDAPSDLMLIERSKVEKLLKYVDLLEQQQEEMRKRYNNCIDGRTT